MATRTARFIFGHRVFIRNGQSGILLEDFFVAAVLAVLVIRLYLLFAYRYVVPHAPVAGQLATEQLHIAHMLWGGLLMLVGFVLLMGFLSRSAMALGAVVGGIGFGAFIDELGKFITRDNDYFFQPAVALIYITFVGLFLALRMVQRPRVLSEQEALANALEYVQQAVIQDFRPEDRQKALALLDQCDPGDPLVPPLRDAVRRMNLMPHHGPHTLAQLRDRLRTAYGWLIRRWWFAGAVVGFFVLQSLSGLYQTVHRITWTDALVALLAGSVLSVILLADARATGHPSLRAVRASGVLAIAALATWGIVLHLQEGPATVVEWVHFVSPTVSGLLVAAGIMLWPHSRLAAFRMFHHAVLVSILVTQVFAFYQEQMLAVIGLVIYVLILITLRYMIGQEELRLGSRPPSPAIGTSAG